MGMGVVMRYAVELYSTEDWGDGPDIETGYKFFSISSCLHYITHIFRKWIDEGCNPEWIGARIISAESSPEYDEPLVEETISPYTLGWRGLTKPKCDPDKPSWEQPEGVTCD